MATENYSSLGSGVSSTTEGNLDTFTDITSLAVTAANTYTTDLEKINAAVTAGTSQAGVSSLGQMVGATLKMTEAEQKYTVGTSLPKKEANTILQEGNEVKKKGS